jgi:hypothetical protein
LIIQVRRSRHPVERLPLDHLTTVPKGSAMSARTTTRTRLFAAATVALAALCLTACEDGTGTVDEGASSVGAATTTSVGTGGQDKQSSGQSASASHGSHNSGGSHDSSGSGGSKGSTGSTGSTGSAGTGSSSGSSGTQASTRLAKCGVTTVKVTATEVTRPINHLLLTATNSGSKACLLPTYPAARFGEAQSVPPVIEDSKPQSTVVLNPGESGYAGVLLSSGDGSGDNGYTAHSLTIPFDDGSVVTASLPSGGVYVDDTLSVTYWQSDMDQALAY